MPHRVMTSFFLGGQRGTDVRVGAGHETGHATEHGTTHAAKNRLVIRNYLFSFVLQICFSFDTTNSYKSGILVKIYTFY